jgi:hypothetical protein
MSTYRFESGDARKDGLFVLVDGVLEAFGFGVSDARRVHLGLIDNVEIVEKGETYLKVEGSTPGVQQLAQVVEPEEPQLPQLVDELQSSMGGD